MLPLRLPGCQLYVLAPLALRVLLLPAQMLPAPVTTTVGAVCTVSKWVLVLVQLPEVALTV